MFDTLFAEVREHSKRFVVYSPDEDGETGVAERFAGRDVTVEHRDLPPAGPPPFLAIQADGEFAGALGLEALEGLLEPPVHRPGDRGEGSDGYQALFEVLDGTVFTALGRRELLAVSREIEDRAFRAGTGTLRAAFERVSALEAQADVYRHLASETDLDVHVYGVAGWDPTTLPGVDYHECDPALGSYWALAFVGEAATRALVARAEADGYSGFWTDDPDLTDDVAGRLESA